MREGIYLIKPESPISQAELAEVRGKESHQSVRSWMEGEWRWWWSADVSFIGGTDWIRLEDENLINFYKAIL